MKACRDCGENLIVPSWTICQACSYRPKRDDEKVESIRNNHRLYLCNFCEELKQRGKFTVEDGYRILRKHKTCNCCLEAIKNLKKERYEKW